MNSKTLISLLFISLSSCSTLTYDIKADEEKIKSNLEDWKKISGDGNIEKILFYWSDDAIFMGPGQPVIRGKDAIRLMVEGSMKIPGFKIVWDDPTNITVSKNGGLAYVIAENHVTMNDSTGKPMTQNNKGLLIWRKEADETWKEVVVMFNADPK